MQHNKEGSGRERRPRGQVPRDGGPQPIGGLTSDFSKLPHPERPWNGNDWRQWDDDQGHVLWMGTVQENWTDPTILGFFNHHGAKVKVHRKGRDNYCFVAFDSAQEAKAFMARFNQKPLPGNLGSGIKFNIRPRTRPRWYREPGDRRSDGSDSRNPRLEDRDGYGVQRQTRGDRKGGRGKGNDEHRRGGGPDLSQYGWGGRGHGREGRKRALFSRERSPGDNPRQVNPRWKDKNSGVVPRSRSWSRSPSRSEPSRDSHSTDGESTNRARSPKRRCYHSSFRQTRVLPDGDSGRKLPSQGKKGTTAAGRGRKGGRGRAARGGRRLGDIGKNARNGNGVQRTTATSGVSNDFVENVTFGALGSEEVTEKGVRESDAESGELVDKDDGGGTKKNRSDKYFNWSNGSNLEVNDKTQGVGGSIIAGDKNANANLNGIEQGISISISDRSKDRSSSSQSAVRELNSEMSRSGSSSSTNSEQSTSHIGKAKEQSRRAEDLALPSSTGGENGWHSESADRLPSEKNGAKMGQEQSQVSRHTLVSKPSSQERNEKETDYFSTDGDECIDRNVSHENDVEEHNRSDNCLGCQELVNSNSRVTEGLMSLPPFVTRKENTDEDTASDNEISKSCRLAQQGGSGGSKDTYEVGTTHAKKTSNLDERKDSASSTPARNELSDWASGESNIEEGHRCRKRKSSLILAGVEGGGNSQIKKINRPHLPPTASLPEGEYGELAPLNGSSPLFCRVEESLERSAAGLEDRPVVEKELFGEQRCSGQEEEVMGYEFDKNRTSNVNGSEFGSVAHSISDGPDSGRLEEPSAQSKRTVEPLSALDSRTQKRSEGWPTDGDPKRLESMINRGAKRRSTNAISLAQVIDHHMARRRLSGRPEATTSRAERGSFCRSTSGMKKSAQLTRETQTLSLASSVKGPLQDGSTVVAAAWANGYVLPLTAAAAPHMRLVAPLLACEPEGRRVIIRTASAVAAGAAVLALPEYTVETTGVCQDGLLLELCPKTDVQAELVGGEEEFSIPASTLANRLQVAFDRLVALNIEFDTVRLPLVEALGNMSPGSSSGDLLNWRNDGTADVLCFKPLSQTENSTSGEAKERCETPGQDGLLERLSQPGESQVLGIDFNLEPLLPRTGLLQSFNTSITAVLSPPGPVRKESSSRRSSVVNLGLLLSDSGVFHSSRSEGAGGRASVACHGSEETKTNKLAVSARGTGNSMVSATVVRLQHINTHLGCVPPTLSMGGLTWREITGLKCVAAVNKLAISSRREVEGKIQLAEGLHTAQIEALAAKITASDVLLVVLAGRQGASTEVIASRLCLELTIKGKKPAVLDTKTDVWQSTTPTHGVGTGRSEPAAISASSPSHPNVDSAALSRAVAALLGQARAGACFRGITGGGRTSGATGAAVATAWQWCDVVIVHGSEALNVNLLPPGGFGLGQAEAISVFVDTVPQVCLDSLTPVDGSDIRMLRALIAQGGPENTAAAGVLVDNGDCKPKGRFTGTFFDTAGFLEEWFVAEEKENGIWRSFRASASVHLNTALPYDLHVLKPLAEPLLRLVPPPIGREGGCNGIGNDGCRSSTYALARSVLRLLGLCEGWHAPPLPGASVLSSLVHRRIWV